MTENNKRKNISNGGRQDQSQKGSALVIAVFVLALVSVFVAVALSRTASEAAAVGNEATEGRTFYAAQGSLEMMTRNFNKVFQSKLNPTNDDLNRIRNGVEPVLTPRFTFARAVDRFTESQTVTLTDKAFAGLYAVQDNWKLETTATDPSGIKVTLTRNVLNNRIPIFQFGIFNDDDLELYRPPRFSFGGRVHTNSNFFISPGSEGVYFNSRVTTVGHIVTQTWRNGFTGDSDNNKTYIKNASGVDKQLLPAEGSVFNTAAGAGDNEFASNPDMPPSKLNASFDTQSAIFDGNLKRVEKKLKLPVTIGDENSGVDLIEMIKRGKETGDLYKNAAGNTVPVTATDGKDLTVMRESRFANKTGIRVSLADSKAKLPGCASGTGTAAVTTDCGIMLNGYKDGTGPVPNPTPSNLSDRARGYQPRNMTDSYRTTRVNGERLGGGREVWIKVETVQTNNAGALVVRDITQDFLSLGVTEQAPNVVDLKNTDLTDYNETAPDNTAESSSDEINQTTAQSAYLGTDSRSILKIQRFAIPGPTIPGAANTGTATNKPPGATKYLTPHSNYNFVVRHAGLLVNLINCPTLTIAGVTVSTCASINETPNSNLEVPAHAKIWSNYTFETLPFSGAIVVPFPIKMFDTREGTCYDLASDYRANKVTKNGAMTMIDIDVANLRRFIRGDFNGLFPTTTPFAAGGSSLRSTDIPQSDGYVLYVSDRRGDVDFDGEYDMEDIYGWGFNSATNMYYGSDGAMQAGEDVNKNGILDVNFNDEAPNKYDDDIDADEAAVTDHKFYRRGVRLINATVLPGNYDAVTAANTRGFTVASENGVYVYGNYNATHVTSVPSTGNTPYENYRPFGKPATGTTAAVLAPTHIPAAIVADAVTVLSNSKYFASGAGLSGYTDGWNDAKSFASPFIQNNRRATETTIRFAMISGDTISSLQSNPHQGGISPRLNGGVHNFKRYLERWNHPDGDYDTNLNYSGSLINLFNSRNNNGAFKCCNTVYNPPTRNWVFDSTFLDPSRLPPGTPFFQYVQITGFERVND